MLNPHTLIISHRGNLSGPNPDYENSPKYIDEAIEAGFDVEIDIRYLNGVLWLGHDRSDYKVSLPWIEARQDKLWAHCKNLESAYFLMTESYINVFVHETDPYSISRSGHFITYPDTKNRLSDMSVAMMPEKVKNWNGLEKSWAICTDFPEKYKKLFCGDI